jgi:hypothetical protein
MPSANLEGGQAVGQASVQDLRERRANIDSGNARGVGRADVNLPIVGFTYLYSGTGAELGIGRVRRRTDVRADRGK